MYERSILILDGPDRMLGDAALGLIAMGIHPHYSTDLDEMIWLAEEHHQRVGALALPAALLLERLEPIRKRLLEPLGLPLACAIPLGPRASANGLERLALAGVRWAAFDPVAPRELRFVLALALSFADGAEVRTAQRVPVDLPVTVDTGERTFRAALRDLSPGGAYLAARSPLRPGTALRLGFTLRDVQIETPAEVRWRTALDGGFAGWLDAGMGVAFGELPPNALEALARFAAETEQRFTLASLEAKA